MSKNNIWYLAGPFHQYQENVKAMAKEHGLVIVDANACESRKGEAKDVPEVTIRPELRAAQSAPAAVGDESVIQGLRANLESVSRTVESFVEGSLQGFGDSDLAVRLFQVLDSVNNGVQSLRRERDGEVEKAQDLQRKLDELLAQTAQGRQVSDEEREAKEIAELKARLDSASVTYRANASKESLLKQVAELGQQ
ncbi:hypothetical protein D3C77_451160 [compost metagenome]